MLFPFPFAAKVWHALPHWPGPRTGGYSSLCVPSWLGAAFSCSPPNCPHLQQNSNLEPQQEGTHNWGLYTWVGWSCEYL